MQAVLSELNLSWAFKLEEIENFETMLSSCYCVQHNRDHLSARGRIRTKSIHSKRLELQMGVQPSSNGREAAATAAALGLVYDVGHVTQPTRGLHAMRHSRDRTRSREITRD